MFDNDNIGGVVSARLSTYNLVLKIFRDWLREQNWEGVLEVSNISPVGNNNLFLVDSTTPCGVFWVDVAIGSVEDPFNTLTDNMPKPLET